MSVQSRTALLEFHVPALSVQNPVTCKTIIQTIEHELKGALDMTEAFKSEVASNMFYVHYCNKNGSNALLQAHSEGLLVLDIHEFVAHSDEPKVTDNVIADLKKKIAADLEDDKSFSLPAIRRGGEFNCFFPSTDKKIIEYDFDELVFDCKSEFQDVKIFHSPQFGNVLILDGDPNMAESDLSYTHAIMGYGEEDYRGKQVLILGGGDGGILHEVLKEKPAFVTMIDIDGVVVEAAKKHLRGICYDSLDKMKDNDYEVLVEDCVPYLKRYVDEGRQFDYIINDLTAVPVTPKPVGDTWDFLRLILDYSMKALAPTGKYYTQGNGANMKVALQMYEDQLRKLSTPVDFKTKPIFVPSYHELWVFYKIWKTSGEKHS